MKRKLAAKLLRFMRKHVAEKRCADMVIGGREDPYLRRWYLLPRNRFFNVYLHQFLRSDDDRALHTHPWASCSFVLEGGYWEVLPGDIAIWRGPGSVSVRGASAAHRILLAGLPQEGRLRPAWSLFLTGPKTHEWFFMCPRGRVHWKDFTAGKRGERIGRGCE